MLIDRSACDRFWRAYLAQLPDDHAHRHRTPDVFGFGDEPELAEELAALVCAGKKRATTSLPIEYTSLGEALPVIGDLSIVVVGDVRPASIIERTHFEHVPFDDVGEAYA